MANEAQQIIGTWKLVSVMYEDQDTKTLTPIMRDNPRGFQIATKDGRWLALACRRFCAAVRRPRTADYELQTTDVTSPG